MLPSFFGFIILYSGNLFLVCSINFCLIQNRVFLLLSYSSSCNVLIDLIVYKQVSKHKNNLKLQYKTFCDSKGVETILYKQNGVAKGGIANKECQLFSLDHSHHGFTNFIPTWSNINRC